MRRGGEDPIVHQALVQAVLPYAHQVWAEVLKMSLQVNMLLAGPPLYDGMCQGSARVARSVAMGGALRFRGQPVVRHVVMAAEIAYGRRSGHHAVRDLERS
jgi:hypothetical protein